VIHAPANAATVSLGHVLVFNESIAGLEEQVRPLPRPDRLRLEAEDMFPLNPGTPYTDDPQPQASGGRVRRAAVDFHCCFAYTPRLFLAPGRYRLECSLQVEGNTTAEVGSLVVSCISTRAILGESQIVGREASADGHWIKQQLTFEVHEDPQDVQIGIVSQGKTPLSADYFDLIAEPMVSSASTK
jgi:hypothetical protein